MHLTNEIKQELEFLDIKANKRLGQNFLIVQSAYTKIINALAIQTGDTIVEVGPGLGTLTKYLADTGAKIIAIEKDKRLITFLNQKFKDYSNIEIIEQDILKFNPLSTHTYKLVGNIPYYLTSKLLRIVYDSWPMPSTMVFMMQKEVVDKILAKPPKMTMLGIATQYYTIPKKISNISRGSFYPEPDVDSAIIRLGIRDEGLGIKENKTNTKQFFKVAQAGFAGKRKQLMTTLPTNLKLPKDTILQALNKANIDSKRRPETLTIEEWESLSKILN